jgi:hypothetical protein
LKVYNIQEATTFNDVARSVSHIYATLDNNQADHQASMVEIRGMIINHLVSVLIDPGLNFSYISPRAVDKCKLQTQKQTKPWLVQLSIATKRKVVEVIPACQLMLGGFPTQATLNVLPLVLTPKIAPSFWSGFTVNSMAIDSFLNSLLSLLAAKF